MESKQIWRTSIKLVREHPYLWLIALIAVVGDFVAVFSYNPHSTRLTASFFIFVVVTLLAEAALIYALGQHLRGEESGFLDALITAVTYIFQILLVKVLPFVLFAAVGVLLLLFNSPLRAFFQQIDNTVLETGIIAFFLLLVTAILFASQIWTFFALCAFLVDNSIDFVFYAWETTWNYRKPIMKLVLPFILIDLILIGVLFLSGTVTYESIYEYTVTEEMAADSQQVGGGSAPGTYTSANRVINSVAATMLKGRGVDLASLPLFVIDNVTIGVVVALIGMLLLPLRAAVLTTAFLNQFSVISNQ